jgi:hypothetical protein
MEMKHATMGGFNTRYSTEMHFEHAETTRRTMNNNHDYTDRLNSSMHGTHEPNHMDFEFEEIEITDSSAEETGPFEIAPPPSDDELIQLMNSYPL